MPSGWPERGWRVTAVDVSPTVLRRAADPAVAAGVAGRITWQAHDPSRTFPDGAYDLVSAQFLHSPGPDGRPGRREDSLLRIRRLA